MSAKYPVHMPGQGRVTTPTVNFPPPGPALQGEPLESSNPFASTGTVPATLVFMVTERPPPAPFPVHYLTPRSVFA